MDDVALADGRTMPRIGLGTFPMTDDDAQRLIPQAVEIGYRLIDTATLYRNESGVGRGIAASGIDREELFVTTKLWDEHGYETSKVAFEGSLERLGLDYVDLYLIHWPLPDRGLFEETWRSLIELREHGLARSIGVSNFARSHIESLRAATDVLPVVNQIELHPYFSQPSMREFNHEHDIVTQAWSPLGRGTDVLANEAVGAIARHHGVTPAQIILRWHLDIGNAVVPKSSDPVRLRQNFELSDIVLTAQDLHTLAHLNLGQRVGEDPHTKQ